MMPEFVTVRPEVQVFAQALEARLRRNDHKGGWREMTVQECLSREQDEAEELEQELLQSPPDLRNVRREIEDRVNFLFFAWHNAEEEFS